MLIKEENPMTDKPRSRFRSLASMATLALALTAGGAAMASPASAETPIDRCGSQGTEWVPDRGPGFDFADSCHRHDLCYGLKPHGDSSAGRKACDREFLDDAYAQCNDGRGAAARFWCQDMADNFYVGIRIFGGGPFDRAQPPVGTVTVGEPETVPYNPTVTVGEPETISVGGGGGGGGGPLGGGGVLIGGSSSGGKTPNVTVGEPETVAE